MGNRIRISVRTYSERFHFNITLSYHPTSDAEVDANEIGRACGMNGGVFLEYEVVSLVK